MTWEWRSSFMPHFTGYVITYPWSPNVLNQSQSFMPTYMDL